MSSAKVLQFVNELRTGETNTCLSDCDVTAEDGEFIAAGLQNCILSPESLRINNCTVTEETIIDVSRALLSDYCRLTELILSFTRLTDGGVRALTDALRSSHNQDLIELLLSGCGISAEGVDAIAQLVEADTPLTGIRLWYNNLDDAAAERLAAALRSNSHLKELHLIQNSGITRNGWRALAAAQLSRSTPISYWWLSVPDDWEDIVAELQEGIFRTKKSIVEETKGSPVEEGNLTGTSKIKMMGRSFAGEDDKTEGLAISDRKKKGRSQLGKNTIVISRVTRNKRKFVTTVSGLASYGIELKKASKIFASKFGASASVDAAADELSIQGDRVYEIEELIIEKFKEILKKNIKVELKR